MFHKNMQNFNTPLTQTSGEKPYIYHMDREELIDIIVEALGDHKAWERNEALCAIVGEYDKRQGQR